MQFAANISFHILFPTIISVPAIAGYTIFSYGVFRGKAGS